MKKNNLNKFVMAIMTLLFVNNSVFAATGIVGEIKHLGVKFIQMSVGVLISVIVIYMCLLGYKKFRMPKMSNKKEISDDMLASAKSIDDAIEHFIKDSE